MYKTIPQTNSLYEANEQGLVRRIGGQPLSPKTKKNGYLEVALHLSPGKQTSRYIHRLVAAAWLGEIPPKLTVNHKDGDKANNNIKNLEVVTQSENNKHSFAIGLKSPTVLRGEDSPRSIATEKDVIKIRDSHKNGVRIIDMLPLFPHLNRDIISSIVTRRTWKHL